MNARAIACSLFAGAFLVTLAGPAAAQVDDARWLPFIGCWQAEGEADAGLLCFGPDQGGVAMTSIVDGEIVDTERLVADGEARPIVAEGCEGTESVSFSEDGYRAFTRSAFSCGDDDRSGTGVMALVSPRRWVDVRALEIRGERVSWVQSYELVGAEALAEAGVSDPSAGLEGSVRAARVIAARDIDLDDVSEASTVVDAEAVVAWVAAEGDSFELSGDELLRLADGGMPESIIDVVVAVSYPERFVVAPERALPDAVEELPYEGRRIPVRVGYRSWMAFDPYYLDGYYGYGSRYGAFGYRSFGYSPYGYSPYGYGGYGYGGYLPYRGPTVVRVERRQPAGGRAVQGRGWTRSSGGDTGRRAQPAGASGSRGATAGSSGSAAPSRGSAQPPARRKAKPRGGTGGSGGSR